MSDEFPPNPNDDGASRSPRRRAPEKQAPPPRREVRQITRSRVTIRKKPLHKKFFEAFRPEDNVGFLEHFLIDVLAPSIRDAVSFASHEAVDTALGTSGISRSRRSRGREREGYTSYNRMSRPSRDRDEPRRGRRDRDEPRSSSYDDREILLDSRAEAEEVLDSLYELVSMYEAATKRDLFSMIGEPSTPVDEDWGWRDLRGSRIHRLGSNGYLLDLPRAEYLD